MDLPALREFGGAVGGRAHQRVGEAHTRAELDQARGFGRRQCVDGNAQFRSSAQEQGCVANRFRGRDEQQSLGLRREAI